LFNTVQNGTVKDPVVTRLNCRQLHGRLLACTDFKRLVTVSMLSALRQQLLKIKIKKKTRIFDL